jgi:hypothetical protein
MVLPALHRRRPDLLVKISSTNSRSLGHSTARTFLSKSCFKPRRTMEDDFSQFVAGSEADGAMRQRIYFRTATKAQSWIAQRVPTETTSTDLPGPTGREPARDGACRNARLK